MANPFEQSDYDQGGGGGGGSGAAHSDYNPFSQSAATAASTSATASGSYKPATTTAGTFSGGGAGGGGGSNEELRRKEAELNRRAAELDEKERQLKKREAELGASGYRPPNWPRCKPILYHDIKEEVPSDLQAMVRAGYFSWLSYCGTMGFNWFAVMCAFAAVDSNKPDGFIAACFFFILGPPLAFMMSYQSLYKGASTGKSSSLLWYCITQGCTLCVAIFMFIGVPNTGGGGIFLLISAAGAKKKPNPFVTIVLGITTGLWGCVILGAIYTMRRVWYYYKVMGGSGKAEQEIKAEMAKHAIASQT